MDIETLESVIQSCNINFLIGSGCSAPYLGTLGNIETLLTELDQAKVESEEQRSVARVSILKTYFDLCIKRNCEIIDDSTCTEKENAIQSYSSLFKSISRILLLRKSNILNKQVNVFTTNMDILIEASMEHSGIHYNDGFSGSLSPRFSLSNFKKSIIQTSAHYGNTSEVPHFNLFKIHGSLTWNLNNEGLINLDNQLRTVSSIKDITLSSDSLVSIIQKDRDGKESHLSISQILEAAKEITLSEDHGKFLEAYRKLAIINPTKDKFKFTTLNYTYYELLRMYSNELERENSVLFVAGFSFADEHIREITLRALNSNPTLLVCIFSYNKDSQEQTQKHLRIHDSPIKNGNLVFMPRREIATNDGEQHEVNHDLASITRDAFKEIISRLENNHRGPRHG